MAAPRHKETADETRERIARVAEELFRRMGFAKTAVADIAAELSMSPANVYRFFPSKNAIVETICNRCLAEIEAQVRAIRARPDSAARHIEAIYLAILRYHRENFLSDRRVHDMVQVAMEHNWQAIEAHRRNIREAVAAIIAEGIASGEFLPHDPGRSSEILLGAMMRFCHPLLVAKDIDQDLEGQVIASLAFILRAIEVNRTPF